MRHSTSYIGTVSYTGTATRAGFVMPRSGARFSHGASLIAAGALAVLFWVAGSPAAVAQPTPAQARNDIDLRPLYAGSMDIADGKRLALGPCASCHGPDGISRIVDVPNLAGQRSPYLYREMRAFLSGARGNDTMNGTITFLSAGALINVAAYYASLDPAQPAVPSAATREVDPVEAGKAAAAGCAACHGDVGITKTPGIPSLVGQEPQYLATAMGEYKDGQRKNDTMKAMIAPVTNANMADIALFYALQSPDRAQTPAPGNASAGEGLSARCSACHGAQGVSGNPSSPSLAGQDAQYLAGALHGYQNGTRGNTTMKALVGTLDDTAIKNLAAYYASLEPQRPNVRRPLSAAEWAQRCDRCHGVNGNSTDPLIPALAAQRDDYLQKALNAFRTGARRSPEMDAMADGLSENDIKNLAAYYSQQKARAVVIVPVPPR
jgi:cytochrome c553